MKRRATEASNVVVSLRLTAGEAEQLRAHAPGASLSSTVRSLALSALERSDTPTPVVVQRKRRAKPAPEPAELRRRERVPLTRLGRS